MAASIQIRNLSTERSALYPLLHSALVEHQVVQLLFLVSLGRGDDGGETSRYISPLAKLWIIREYLQYGHLL